MVWATLDPQSTQIELLHWLRAKSAGLLRARVFKRCSAFKPSAHADNNQDLSARSHPWRLPRVLVPFAGSQHHKAALPAHVVHAVLSRRRSARAQGLFVQSRCLRTVQGYALHQDSDWIHFDGALPNIQATFVHTGGRGDEGEGRVSRRQPTPTVWS